LRQLREKVPVEDIAGTVVPAPVTMALNAEAVVSAGKIVTFAVAVVFAGERRTVVAKCKTPRGESVARAF
jgi:hypothetical protein